MSDPGLLETATRPSSVNKASGYHCVLVSLSRAVTNLPPRPRHLPNHPIRTCCRDETLYRPDQSAGTAAWSLDTQDVQVLRASRTTRLPTAARCSSSLSPMSQSTTTVRASLHGPVTVLWPVQHETQLSLNLPTRSCVCACGVSQAQPTTQPGLTARGKPPSHPSIRYQAKPDIQILENSMYNSHKPDQSTSTAVVPLAEHNKHSTAQHSTNNDNQITQTSRTTARSSSYLVILYCTVLCCTVLCQQTNRTSLPTRGQVHATPRHATQPNQSTFRATTLPKPISQVLSCRPWKA